MQRKPEDRQQRRDEVLRKTAKIFCEKGYRATTLKDIGKAMDFSSAALYYYVDNKQELLRDIVMEPSKRLVEIAEQHSSLDMPAMEQLRKIVFAHVQFMLSEREIFSVMFRERMELDRESEMQLKSYEHRYFMVIRDVLAAGKESGEISVGNPSVSALSLLGMINWTTRWYKKDGDLAPADIASLFYEQFLLGIAPRQRG